MVKGNNAIPHQHQRKHWNPNSSQRGNIKTFLDQPMRKERRRRLRVQKAKKLFPRPVKSLRPSVACPTIRYNMKKRLGRGFSTDELSAAGITAKYAKSIGVRVDLRRKNLSEEGLSRNVQRLKTYLAKLVLFPLNNKKPQKGDSSEAETKNAVQDVSRWGKTVAHPSVRASLEAPRKLTPEEKKKNVYRFLKKNISAAQFLSARLKRAKAKADKAAAEEEKKKKN